MTLETKAIMSKELLEKSSQESISFLFFVQPQKYHLQWYLQWSQEIN